MLCYAFSSAIHIFIHVIWQSHDSVAKGHAASTTMQNSTTVSQIVLSSPAGKHQFLHWVLVQEGISPSFETCHVFVDIPAIHRDLQNNWMIALAICVFTYTLVSAPYGNVDFFKALYHPTPTAETSMESKVLSGFIYITHVLCSGKDNIMRLWSQHFACCFPGKYINWGFRITSPMSSLGCLMMNTVKLSWKVEETAGTWRHLKIAADQN